jgi:hypothetical protein
MRRNEFGGLGGKPDRGGDVIERRADLTSHLLVCRIRHLGGERTDALERLAQLRRKSRVENDIRKSLAVRRLEDR